MPSTRWDPLREMDDLSDRIDRVLGAALLGPTRPRGFGKEEPILSDWTPLVDVEETDAEFLLSAELPDVRREDIKLTIGDGVLCIEGERKQTTEVETRKVHRLERSFGRFVRRFTMPPEAQDASVTAEFKDGVLIVRIAKAATARPKSIEIRGD